MESFGSLKKSKKLSFFSFIEFGSDFCFFFNGLIWDTLNKFVKTLPYKLVLKVKLGINPLFKIVYPNKLLDLSLMSSTIRLLSKHPQISSLILKMPSLQHKEVC